MNKLTIIGNITKKPELRTTTNGVSVCSFNVAVNKPRRNGEQQDPDYFSVTAWREKGELCAKFLDKGKKVCVIGPVSVRTYTKNDGSFAAVLEITADEIEFLSPRVSDPETPPAPVDAATGFTQVDSDELPFD